MITLIKKHVLLITVAKVTKRENLFENDKTELKDKKQEVYEEKEVCYGIEIEPDFVIKTFPITITNSITNCDYFVHHHYHVTPNG